MENMSQPQKKVVTLRYEDLIAGKDLTDEIFEAYGPDGLGALTISGIPGFVQQREELLPLGHSVRKNIEAHSRPSLTVSLCLAFSLLICLKRS
jgi:hypothetical protein